jgi:ATP-binding cassette subfamily B (MDR/TAP) protein 1
VTLGGHDILRLHVPTLRSQIAIVSQQPTIFPGTIHDNVRYGMSGHSVLASDGHVREAAQAAGIDDFIASLPMGYSTVIGDGGVGLSGGQKQRIVIARALLRQPQILILDEATSSLDPAGTRIVRETIRRLIATRSNLTVILITHSKEMIEIADNVIVLDQGVVVEDGPCRPLSQRVGGKLYNLIHDPEVQAD